MLGRKAESSSYFQEGLVRQQWRNAVDMELTIWFKNDVTVSSSLEKDRNLSILGCYESGVQENGKEVIVHITCLLYTSPSPRDLSTSRMPSSA